MTDKMKLIIENWQRYERHHQILDDEEFITEVLGLDLPMLESSQVTTKVQELVIEEYIKMQDWWAPMDMLNEEGSWWSRLKNVGKGTARILLLLKSLITGGAGSLKTYLKAIVRKGIGDLKNKLFSFLDIIIEKKDVWNMPNIGSIAEKVKGLVVKAYNKLESLTGWTKAIAATSLALGIRYVISQIQELIEKTIEFYKGGAETLDETLKNLIIEKIKGFVVKIAQEIAKGVGAAWGDVTAWWGWATKIFGGLEFVTDALESTLSFAKARGIAEEKITYRR